MNVQEIHVKSNKIGSIFLEKLQENSQPRDWLENFYLKSNPFEFHKFDDNSFLIDSKFHEIEGIKLSELIASIFKGEMKKIAIVSGSRIESYLFVKEVLNQIKATLNNNSIKINIEDKLKIFNCAEDRNNEINLDDSSSLIIMNFNIKNCLSERNLDFFKIRSYITCLTDEDLWYLNQKKILSFNQTIKLKIANPSDLVSIFYRQVKKFLDKSENKSPKELFYEEAVSTIFNICPQPISGMKLIENIISNPIFLNNKIFDSVNLARYSPILLQFNPTFFSLPKNLEKLVNILKLYAPMKEGHLTTKELLEIYLDLNLNITQSTIVRQLNRLIELDFVEELQSDDISELRFTEIRKNQETGIIISYKPTILLKYYIRREQKYDKKNYTEKDQKKQLRDYISLYSGLKLNESLFLNPDEEDQEIIQSNLVQDIVLGDMNGIILKKYLFPYKIEESKLNPINLENYSKVKEFIQKKGIIEGIGKDQSNPLELPKFAFRKDIWTKKKIIINQNTVNEVCLSYGEEGKLIGEGLIFGIPKNDLYTFIIFALLNSQMIRAFRLLQRSKVNQMKLIPFPNLEKIDFRELKELDQLGQQLLNDNSERKNIIKKIDQASEKLFDLESETIKSIKTLERSQSRRERR